MLILHTSDWHLGAIDREKSLYEDQRFFIDQICDIAERENVSAVVIAGDVYDRAITSAEAISLYDYAMTRLCLELKKQVIIVAGNHDSAERLSSCSSLLQKTGLHVQGALAAKPAIVSVGDVDFYLMPWFTEEKVKSLYPDRAEEIGSLSDAYRVVCDYMRESFVPGRRHVAVSHSFITDAEVSESDRAAVVGYATQVAASVFEGFDYVALGHIHKPQNIGDNIRYSGTPMPYSFGKEENQEKSVTIVDTEKPDKEHRKIIPVPLLHMRKTIEGTLEEILTGDYPEEVLSGYVNIKVTDDYVGNEKRAEILDRFENALMISGVIFNDSETELRMTMDEFRELESNPVELFKHFYNDTMEGELDDHLVEMFKKCLSEGEE